MGAHGALWHEKGKQGNGMKRGSKEMAREGDGCSKAGVSNISGACVPCAPMRTLPSKEDAENTPLQAFAWEYCC